MSEERAYIERIAGLIIKYHRGELTADEQLELGVWCAQSARNQHLFDQLSDPDFVKNSIRELPNLKLLKRAGWDKIETILEAEDPVGFAPVRRRIGWMRYIVAASLAGLVGIGGWLYIRSRSVAASNTNIASHFKGDVKPGGNKAILTLADGSSVVLDSATSGTVARQGEVKVLRQGAGSLTYTSLTSQERPAAIAYNTLTTPAAGQFQVSLPDGSKVWLNNASSLRYPVAFRGNSREVELQGEAYFEIAKNAAMPFKVKVGSVNVDVLGTSFNIMAYPNENTIRTTLLSGGVRVGRGGKQLVLQPGEQAQAAEDDKLALVKDVDAEGVIAWKNGLFHFERADIRTVMRNLSRWYDVDVVYDGPVTNHLFGGDIQRDLNLAQVLEILEKNQVHFDLEGRKITVRP